AAAAEALGRVRAAPAEATLGPAVARLGRGTLVVPVAGLDDLAAVVVAATAGVGAPPDPRPFAGHLTVARLRRRTTGGVVGAPLAARFGVAQIHLVRSHLGSTGASYEVVASQPLVSGGAREG